MFPAYVSNTGVVILALSVTSCALLNETNESMCTYLMRNCVQKVSVLAGAGCRWRT